MLCTLRFMVGITRVRDQLCVPSQQWVGVINVMKIYLEFGVFIGLLKDTVAKQRIESTIFANSII